MPALATEPIRLCPRCDVTKLAHDPPVLARRQHARCRRSSRSSERAGLESSGSRRNHCRSPFRSRRGCRRARMEYRRQRAECTGRPGRGRSRSVGYCTAQGGQEMERRPGVWREHHAVEPRRRLHCHRVSPFSVPCCLAVCEDRHADSGFPTTGQQRVSSMSTRPRRSRPDRSTYIQNPSNRSNTSRRQSHPSHSTHRPSS